MSSREIDPQGARAAGASLRAPAPERLGGRDWLQPCPPAYSRLAYAYAYNQLVYAYAYSWRRSGVTVLKIGRRPVLTPPAGTGRGRHSCRAPQDLHDRPAGSVHAVGNIVMGCSGGRLAARIAGRAVRDRGGGGRRVGAGRGGVPVPDLLLHLAGDRPCSVRPGRATPAARHLPWLGLAFFVADPGHRRAGLRAADLPVRARGPRPRGAGGDGRRRRERRPDPAPGQRGQGRWPPRSASAPAGRSAGRARSCRSARRWPPASASGRRMPENRMRILVACGAGGGIAATFNAPITGVFFGVEIILREFSVDAHVHRHAVGDARRRGRHPDPRRPAVPERVPGRHHAASTPRDYLLVAVLAVARRPDRAAVQDRRLQDGRPVGRSPGRTGRNGPGRLSAGSRSA